MAEKRARGYCATCDQDVMAVKRRPNDILHLLLSIFTVGLWIPVWIVISIFTGTSYWRCPNCGCKANMWKHAQPRGRGMAMQDAPHRTVFVVVGREAKDAFRAVPQPAIVVDKNFRITGSPPDRRFL